MNKVVCNLCGTSYPENAAQCPICGYARSAESSVDSGSSTYTYVKGGRFSKANVKKRNKAAGSKKESAVAVDSTTSEKHSGKGLTIVVIILLLAIVAVLGYIALRFFLPNDFLFEGLDNMTLPNSSAEQEYVPEETETVQSEVPTQPVETEPDLSCTGIILSDTKIAFTDIGEEMKLVADVQPVDTVDQLTYVSSDDSVVTVSNDGTVKSVGEGNATITVTCGAITVECSVSCTLPTEPVPSISLNRKEITFNVEGQSWLLYDGDIPVEDIVWSSDDNGVATIEAGKVVAVANGDTTVHAAYEGSTVSCIIHCKLDEEGSGESSGIVEAGGETKKNCKLYNPFGYADDVTLNVDESFTLRLVDEYLNIITDAEWSVEDPEVCSYKDSKVTALKSGKTNVCAKYGGVTYKCVVRVN